MTKPFRFSVSIGKAADVRAFRELARQAEDLGYSAMTMPDHLDAEWSPTVALAAAASATTALRFVTLVLGVDYRHPAFVAKEAATLDLVSDGRLELGLGAGWQTSDYGRAGLRLDPPGVRISRLAEYVRVVKGLFADGPLSFAGEHYRVEGLDGQPKPAQRPHPPILLAGGAKRMLSLAAREADIVGLNVSLRAGVIDATAGASATPAATDEKLGWIRAAAGDRFDRLELQTRVHLATVTDDRASVAELMGPALGISPHDALGSPHALVGTVEQICDDLLARRERWGINYIGWNADSMVAMAPVVERLAGR